MVQHKHIGEFNNFDEIEPQTARVQAVYIPQHLMQEFYNIMSQCMALLDDTPLTLQPTANQEGFWILDSKASRVWLLHQPGK